MKEDKSSNKASSEIKFVDKGALESTWRRVVKRRSFLHGLSAAAATVPAAAIFAAERDPDRDRDDKPLTRGDVAILRMAAAVELIEADLWQQYNELGGAVDHNDNPNPGNPSYIAALANLDSDMPQYISDNTDDEISHAAFLNAYLESKGEEPVSFKGFQTLQPSKATGANQDARHITNLQALNVDTSWYFRYRSTNNPDLGAEFPQLLNIKNQPAIPISDKDTDPNALVPLLQSLPITYPKARRMQAIANTAGLYFAFIEQGGTSLYPSLAQRVTDGEVLRILLSIGPTETAHFQTWHDKAGNAPALTDPTNGLEFPDLNSSPFGGEDFQTNLIMPEPTVFLSSALPVCSIIRPTLRKNAGARAVVAFLTAMNLFQGQSAKFFTTLNRLAAAADKARRQVD